MNQTSKYYKYNLAKCLYTLFNFKKVTTTSKQTFAEYRDYCLNYPRISDESTSLVEPIIVNSYQAHLKDLAWKEMSLETFSEAQIEKITIGTKTKPISCLVVKHAKSDKWVIGLHGWTEDKYLALRQVWHYWQNGYNVLTFDNFAHGDTYGEYTDIGLSSWQITQQVVAYVKSTYAAQIIGLIGNSMGASSAILYAQQTNNSQAVNWIVADCGFSELKLQYRFFIENNFFKKQWWKVGFGFTKKFSKITNTNQSKFNLLKGMKKCKNLPIFFIHSKKDTFVPCFMSEDMYQAKIKHEQNNLSQIWTPNESGHVWILADCNKEYVDKTLSFSRKWEK